MAVLDADFVSDLTTAEGGGDTLWSLPIVAPACEPPDWASLLEEAEARVQEERGLARTWRNCAARNYAARRGIPVRLPIR